MKTKVKLEFVSDVSCTWCAIGLQSLQQAILDSAEYADEVRAQERKWRAFGVNSVPTMVLDGAEVLVGSRPAAAYADAIRRAAAAQTASVRGNRPIAL